MNTLDIRWKSHRSVLIFCEPLKKKRDLILLLISQLDHTENYIGLRFTIVNYKKLHLTSKVLYVDYTN